MEPVPDLDALYDPPSDRIQNMVLDRLVDFHRAYLAQATFFCLATGNRDGLDASPRGGAPGFVQVLDDRRVAFADWPGNNRIASLRNLAQDERVAMLFLFPGLELFMRINGRGRISTVPDLLAGLEEGGRRPKTAVVVAIDEVLFHCGKAIHRARLWEGGAHPERAGLPTPGAIAASFEAARTGKAADPAEAAQLDGMYRHAVRHALYD